MIGNTSRISSGRKVGEPILLFVLWVHCDRWDISKYFARSVVSTFGME
jgi:hypothetical protein